MRNTKEVYQIQPDNLSELQRTYEIERNIKNNLYAFILSMGLIYELQDYSFRHDMSSPDGHLRCIKHLLLLAEK